MSLEALAFLPPGAALSLLLAVWPLARARRDVQDYIVMLLRKAMFRSAGLGWAGPGRLGGLGWVGLGGMTGLPLLQQGLSAEALL